MPSLGRSHGRVVGRRAGGRQKERRSIDSKDTDAGSRFWNSSIDSAAFLPAFDVGLLRLCLRSWCVKGREGSATRAPHALNASNVAASGGGSGAAAPPHACFSGSNAARASASGHLSRNSRALDRLSSGLVES